MEIRFEGLRKLLNDQSRENERVGKELEDIREEADHNRSNLQKK